MSAKRTRKLFRKKMWAVQSVASGHVHAVADTKKDADYTRTDYAHTCRLIPVLVSELPKPSAGKRGKDK